jgi:cation:H+ antiporter
MARKDPFLKGEFMIYWQLALMVLSLVVLYFGAEFALDGAEKVGQYFGLSPLVIGLVIVGFGTSLPEFFVSQISCWEGHPGMALGNIVGSNVANLFLIMGISGLLTELHLSKSEMKEQMLWHLGLTVLLIFVLSRPEFSLISASFLGAFFLVYMGKTYRKMKKDKISQEPDPDRDPLSWFIVLKLLLGFLFLYVGGDLLVKSGSKLGQLLGLSEYVISAIFVAFGTSLPELITALLACWRKKDTDLITGNIIGSNIFNVAFVLASLGGFDFKLQNSYRVEMLALLGAALFLLGLTLFKKNFSRLSGIFFVLVYGGVVYYWVQI